MSETVDKSRFASAIKVSRIAKTELDDQGRPTTWGRKPFTPQQVVLDSGDYIYVSRAPVAPGTSIPRLVNLDPDWTLPEQYATRLSINKGSEVKGRPGWAGLVVESTNEDFEHALQVACDMGRWDIAYMMVVRTYGLGHVGPANVLWETFPHVSQMAIVSNGELAATEYAIGQRLFVPSGLTRSVVESWWAWQGGYHNPRESLWVDWDEYAAVMKGLRNPFALAGVPENLPVHPGNRPVAAIPASLDPSDLAGRPWYYGDGVAYLANSRGTVLPYWFITGEAGSIGPVGELAWGPDVRDRLARKMNLPVLIARRSSAGSV